MLGDLQRKGPRASYRRQRRDMERRKRVEERNRGRHDPEWAWKNRSLHQILGYFGHVIHGFPFVVLFVESLVKI